LIDDHPRPASIPGYPAVLPALTADPVVVACLPAVAAVRNPLDSARARREPPDNGQHRECICKQF
jgi:hypothetical protein